MTSLVGGCRCGAIRYECSSEPLAVSFCYCRDCQKASGGPFCNYAVVPQEAVTVRGSELSRYGVQAESGNTVYREFCTHCGSPLFARNGQVFVLTVGTLDNPEQLKPTIAIWLDSKPAWAPLPEDVECFAQNPPFTVGD
jgi:hypothetical protein